jgi:ribosomal protein S18 acetylase RimI-like enzyme
MNLECTPADRLALPELAALWNRAYSGYPVPLSFTPELLQRHIERAGASLALSRLLWRAAAPAPCGLSLAAARGERAYLAGFGIAPEARRQGLGQALLQAQVAAWQQQGLRQAQLEVMEGNPARQLYRQAGFVERRRLLVLQGTLPAAPAASPAMALQPAGLDTLAGLHARLNSTHPPTWRRELATVQQVLQAPGASAWQAADGRAHAVLLPTPSAIAVLDAAAADAQAAAALWSALGALHPQASWRLVDEPEDTPLARTALAAGLAVPLAQVEMVLRW